MQVNETSCLAKVLTFSLTRDMLTDLLHLHIKGIMYKLMILTFKKGLPQAEWTMTRPTFKQYQGMLKGFLQLPSWVKKPRLLTSEIGGSSADEVLTFMRLYAYRPSVNFSRVTSSGSGF